MNAHLCAFAPLREFVYFFTPSHAMGYDLSLASKIDRFRLGMRSGTSARYAGKVGLFLTLAVKPTCFQRRSRNLRSLAPLGERVDCNRHFHQVKAGRVRGSKTLGTTEMLLMPRAFHFCLLPLLLRLFQTNSILVKTPSPPRGRGEMYR